MPDNEEKKESRTEEEIEKDWRSLVKPAPPDHPIFSMGYIVGGFYPIRSSKRKQEKLTEESKEEGTEKNPDTDIS